MLQACRSLHVSVRYFISCFPSFQSKCHIPGTAPTITSPHMPSTPGHCHINISRYGSAVTLSSLYWAAPQRNGVFTFNSRRQFLCHLNRKWVILSCHLYFKVCKAGSLHPKTVTAFWLSKLNGKTRRANGSKANRPCLAEQVMLVPAQIDTLLEV